jgi:hypothetical protein
MTPLQLEVWERRRRLGKRRFVLQYGGAMAVAYFIGFVLFFAAGVRFIFREDVLWGVLLALAAVGSGAFGLALSWYIWRRQEADYHFTVETDKKVGAASAAAPSDVSSAALKQRPAA